jgi:transposase-like protein
MSRMKTKEEYENIIDEFISRLDKACPRCSEIGVRISASNLQKYRCKNKLQRHCFSIFAKTPFEHCRSSLGTRLQIFDCWIQGISTKHIAWIMNIERQLVWRALKQLAKVLIPLFYQKIEPIGGENIVVEVDESKFGKVKYHRGHRVEGVWVVGLVERTEERKMVLVPVLDRTKETLFAILKRYIKQESTIYTDCFRSYIGLDRAFAGHETVNHSRCFVDPISGVHTNTIEGNWCAVKNKTPIRKRTRKLITIELVRHMLVRLYPYDTLENLLNLFI